MQNTYHTITRADCRPLTEKVIDALTPLLSEHGLRVTCRNSSFSSTSVKVTLMITIQETATGKSPEQDTFERHAAYFGLDPANYGRTFTIRGRTFILSGLNLAARKRPIQATADGQTWVFPRFTPSQLKEYDLIPAPATSHSAVGGLQQITEQEG
jgi:hypothetical protein